MYTLAHRPRHHFQRESDLIVKGKTITLLVKEPRMKITGEQNYTEQETISGKFCVQFRSLRYEKYSKEIWILYFLLRYCFCKRKLFLLIMSCLPEKLQSFYCWTKTEDAREGWGTELRELRKKELKR
ncbi:unnamed protein product [Rangifer tarandus platyrhynchus]|uniref:Uncharacterized protein n=1 Tax=Rangifer tarandus platyrhynchus TaxID=3082113 RepID=A0ABN8Y9X1_RANTA|nr:unnamed protein product [Rangifer tarandus platyrhynchus]